MEKVSPLRIAFLDVGHGDSIVITITDKKGINRAIVVDTPNSIKTKNYIKNNNVDVIDYIFITHFHTDHYSGINSLVESLVSEGIEVKNICWEKDKVLRTEDEQTNYALFTTKLFQNHLKLGIGCISKKFDNNEYKNLYMDDVDGVKIRIIYPNTLASNSVIGKNINNTSTVLKIEYNGIKVILPGDLEGEGWNFLKSYIEDKELIKCDVLKMPHHGDYFNKKVNSIDTKEIIDLTDPSYAIISTANNKLYNHPDKDTIKYLKDKDINIFCTQVTDECTSDRLDKRNSILEKLNVETKKYNKNWCPCMGDVVIEIDQELRLISHKPCMIEELKKAFSNPLCMSGNC
ncbi:MAG: MBL fold metallo-hydrolase [Anaeromicrobium sp.]|jgi:competence protein ComEC|uniref:ComEC/Rec2 family competence protein n=1 Tax=Anaeromicrobium sp. TaxID=1929132 RepID=UPI0025F6CC65|nr:MBL fold metallo-hydrolase [Anaeromicrobium sp.]MCT4593935.1 MBL fold metallo-hydrolase [Anaeromicrobium sp.]